MKTTLITAALILSTALVTAQEKKQATVRIKKIENINGVEKVTDTTYTTDDVSTLNAHEPNIQMIETGDGKPGEMKKVIIINGNEVKGDEEHIKVIRKGEGIELDAAIEKALKEAGVDPNEKGVKKMIVINEDGKSCDKKDGKNVTKIVVIKNVKITDADAAELKKINQTSETDGKLAVDKMNFYPNPNNGKFNLSFSLPEKGDAEITILNIEGKKVYSENLPNFVGAYDKEIDISKNPKGVYFVRIEQGKHAQVKKVVLD
ncbi:MAG: T9SS type A sorting domain-containing protein [Bacteroidota bacterium]|nr:T9SS type A sorting domain-containing protein [Bacteroidota bacterium]